MDKIGKKIKKIRELRNYSRLYVAKELEISLNSYGKIERNEVDMSLKRLLLIAKVLGVSVEIILDFDENKILKDTITSSN